MNCANCNTTLRIIHIEGWCPDCVGKLIDREEVAREQGWQGAWAAWDRIIGPAGEATPLIEAVERAFQAGWAARGLPDPSRHELSPEADQRKNRALAFVIKYVREGCHHGCGENCSHAGQERMKLAREILVPPRDYSGLQAAVNDAVKCNPVGDKPCDLSGCQWTQPHSASNHPRPKPPLGVMPRHLHREGRMRDLAGAIERYAQVGIPGAEHVFHEWIRELAELSAQTDKTLQP